MVCPLGTEVRGVNTRTGVTVAPDIWDPRVMEVKMIPVVPPIMATNVPVLLAPIIAPALSVVAAAMVVP